MSKHSSLDFGVGFGLHYSPMEIMEKLRDGKKPKHSSKNEARKDDHQHNDTSNSNNSKKTNHNPNKNEQ